MSFHDEEDRPHRSSRESGRRTRSHRSGGAGGPQGSSYTDRFRIDTPFSQPNASAALASASSSGGRVRPEDVSTGQILTLVDKATAATLKEPDLYLNLQIADLVNAKKGSAPRDVAMKLAKIANSRFVMSAVLALSVLDVCVKNCGYPFHLAISRRDFLNLLVRGFPERPPLHYSRVQTLILEMIEEWNATLVKTSRYRDDLGFIRDMHRLLSYKGYIFPEVSADEIAALTPEQDTLKSAAELEREDREAQSAKLQELIRSGSPADLKEANRLMSIMAGFRETRVDYHAKVAAELEKVRRKAEILDEMLQQVASSGNLPKGGADDVFTELTQSLKAALPKIKHILADEESMEEDEDARQKILALKQNVETVLTKHAELTGGSFEAESVPSGTVQSTAAKFASLIDIGDDEEQPSGENNTQGDLLGLSFGALSLGTSNTATTATSSNAGSSNATTNSNDILDLSGPRQDHQDRQDSVDPFGLFAGNSTTTSQPTSSAEFQETASAETPVFADDTLSIVYIAKKSEGKTELELVFSNPGGKKITNLEVQLAPPKSLSMHIGPLSSTQLEPRQQRGITQLVTLEGAAAPKLRWKVNYNWGLDSKSVGGDIKKI